MTPPTISVDRVADLDVAVAQIAAALRAGGAVVLPTDTVYGLVALPGDQAAIDRLFALKGRGADVPVAVLCADVTQALELADPSVPAAILAVAQRWWPGPLTLVLPRRNGVHLHLGEPSSTVGLRVPAHDVVRAVAAIVGPIAATSANRHGEPTPTTAAEAAAMLGSGVALVVDGGRVAARASTVIDASSDHWTVLREGPIPSAEVLALSDAPTDDGR